ncbi:MAG TPA: hypothetical protein VEI02_07025, partial [Planctomycetota bacterium]|nr:hypothetical protein [Planctomycetota bacterium]
MRARNARSPQRPPRRRRRLVVATAALGAVVFGAVAAVPRMRRAAADRAAAELSEALGARVTLERLDGGLLREATLVGLRVEGPPGAALAQLHAPRVRVAYRLGGLLRGELDALRELEAHDVAVDLDLREADGASDVPSDAAPAGRRVCDVLRALPPTWPKLRVAGALRARLPEGDLVAETFEISADGAAAHLRARGPTPPWGGAPLDVGLTATRVNDGSVRLRGDLGDGVTLHRVDLACASPLSAEVEARAAGGVVRATLRDGRLRVRADDVDLALRPAALDAALPAEALPREGRLNVEAETVVEGSEVGAVSGAATLTGARTAQGVPVDVEIAGAWDGRRGVVRRLRARFGDARAEADDVTLDASAPWRTTGLARLAVDVPDLAALRRDLAPWAVLPYVPAELRSLTVDAASDDARRVVVRSGVLRTSRGAVRIAGVAGLPAAPDAWREATFDLKAEVEAVDLATLAPPGLDLPPTTGAADAVATLRGSAAAPDVAVDVRARDVAIDGRALGEVRVRAQWRGGVEVAVETLEIDGPGVAARAAGRVDLERTTVADATFDVRIPDVAAWRDLVPGAGDLRGRLELRGAAASVRRDAARGSVEARGSAEFLVEAATWNGWAVDRLVATATLDGAAVSVASLSASSSLGTVEAEARGDLRDLASAEGSVRFDLAVDDAAPWLARFGVATDLAGPVAAKGEARTTRASDLRAWSGAAGLRSKAPSIAGLPLADVAVDATFDDARLTVAAASAASEHGTVELAGDGAATTDGFEGRIDRLRVVHAGREVRLASPARWARRGDGWAVENLDVVAGGGVLRGRAALRGDAVDVDLVGEGLDPTAFGLGAGGRVGGRLRVAGPATAPEGDAELTSESLTWSGVSARVRLAASQGPEGIALRDLSLDGGAAFRVEGSGIVPTVFGVGGLRPAPRPGRTASFRLSAQAPDLRPFAVLGIPAQLEARDLRCEIAAEGDALRATAGATDLAWRAEDARAALPSRSTARLDVDATAIRAEAVLGDGSAVDVRLHGELAAGLRRDALRESLRAAREAPLRAGLVVDARDLAAFRDAISGLERLEGRASAR